MLRIVFWSKREEVIGVWRKLYDEHDICLPSMGGHQIKDDEIGGACGRYWGGRM
jgi:hypothetical protein